MCPQYGVIYAGLLFFVIILDNMTKAGVTFTDSLVKPDAGNINRSAKVSPLIEPLCVLYELL